jgi:hypothetical protein
MGHGTETEGGVGRGTGDGMKWEGEAPAEPNLSANREIGKSGNGSEWRLVKWQRMVSGGQQMVSSKCRMVFSGGQCSCTAEKFLALKNCAPHLAPQLGSLGSSPSQMLS